jgi:mannose-6-phosphate isomerase-like protein (cupin superfamily)
MGLYNLPMGSTDKQQPHNEDEVYYVLSGRASITVGDEKRAVTPGSIIFIAAHVPHFFCEIQEDLTLLVFFAPAESLD